MLKESPVPPWPVTSNRLYERLGRSDRIGLPPLEVDAVVPVRGGMGSSEIIFYDPDRQAAYEAYELLLKEAHEAAIRETEAQRVGEAAFRASHIDPVVHKVVSMPKSAPPELKPTAASYFDLTPAQRFKILLFLRRYNGNIDAHFYDHPFKKLLTIEPLIKDDLFQGIIIPDQRVAKALNLKNDDLLDGMRRHMDTVMLDHADDLAKINGLPQWSDFSFLNRPPNATNPNDSVRTIQLAAASLFFRKNLTDESTSALWQRILHNPALTAHHLAILFLGQADLSPSELSYVLAVPKDVISTLLCEALPSIAPEFQTDSPPVTEVAVYQKIHAFSSKLYEVPALY